MRMRMRMLYPPPDGAAAVDPVAAYGDADRPRREGRPWVVVDMIASADGATTLEGRSGGLGAAGDKAVFRSVRAAADVILVGSGTFSADGYGPPRLAADLQHAREARGLARQPRIAVVTGRIGLDLSLPFFTDSPNVPIVVTAQGSDPARREAASQVAEVLVCGAGASVDLAAALAALADRGAVVVVCEGGPSLNADLAAADLVDEVCLTVAPFVAGGHSKTIFAGVDLDGPLRFRLAHVLEADDGYLFLRYVRDRP